MRRLPLSVTAVVLAGYLFTTCRTVYFGDSGELIAAAHSLGSAHPPGYPLYTLLGRVALLIPAGEAAFRVNALSALFGALTCGLVCALLRMWGMPAIAACSAALSLAVSAELWAVSTVAEVYTLHLALIAGLLVVAARFASKAEADRRGRALVAAGLLVGLGIAHRPTLLLVLPAAGLIALAGYDERAGRGRLPRSRSWIVALLAAAAVPALLYGSLILRSSADPAVNWGRPDDLGALWRHVTTQGFRSYVLGPAGWIRAAGWERVFAVVGSGFGHVGLPLALLGAATAVRGRLGTQARRGAYALLLLALITLLFGLSYATEDQEVLFLPLGLVTAALAGLGIGAIARWAPGPRRAAVLLAAGTIVAAPLVGNLHSSDLRRVTAARDYGEDMLATVPPGGVLFVEGDDAFVLSYLTQVLGERPDLKIYDRNGLMFADLLHEPGPARRRGEGPFDYRIRREREWIAAEQRRIDPRPILFMTWPGYDLEAPLLFAPRGLFYQVGRRGERFDDDRLWRGYREEEIRRQALRVDRPFARSVAAVYPLMRGEQARFEGRFEEAFERFDEASRLAGPSESVHNYIGTIFGSLGDFERAEREFVEALRIKPVSVRAWNNLARARWLRGDRDGAEEAWRKSLEIDPLQPDVRTRLDALHP